MNNQTIFLAKIQQAITLLDEIDTIIDENPTMQQNIDWEISDYLHLLENETLTEKARLEIDGQIARCRKVRRQLCNISSLAKVYVDNRDKLRYKSQREFLVANIKSQLNKLDNDYKYRVLDKDTVDGYIKKEEETIEEPKKKRTRQRKVSKEEILYFIDQGLKNKEIADKFGISPSALSHLKDVYEIPRREYKKKGD